MKLLDLLKSLNNGATLNPDIDTGIDAIPTVAATDNRQRLLTELTSIAQLLDAPAIEPTPTPPALSDSKNLLDLEHIFGESDELDTADHLFIEPASSPLQFMPVDNTISAHNNRQQIIASLLDELLPIFETALAQRLNQLDHTTLQQWHQTLLETAVETSTLPSK